MEALKDLLGIGLEPGQMNVLQMGLRGVVIFFAALIMVRSANRRFLAKLSPLDVILGFVLASLLARAINGSGPLFQSIAVGFLLVFLHRGLAALAFRFDLIGRIVKGQADPLVLNGTVDQNALSRHNITRTDLVEGLRLSGNVEDPGQVQKAVLERDGSISVVKRQSS